MGVVQSAGDSGDDGDSKFGRQGCGLALSQQWATSMPSEDHRRHGHHPHPAPTAENPERWD